MPKCLICDSLDNANTIEHIVSESFGNTQYALPKGIICNACNNAFSEFEGKTLSKSIFGMERAALGIKSKAGKPANVEIGGLKIKGHKDFRKNFIKVNGLTESNTKINETLDGTITFTVGTFDKGAVVQTSRTLLKMGIESVFKSKNKVFYRYDFSELKDFILKKKNQDWPFVLSKFEVSSFQSIPSFSDKHHLNRIHCSLRYLEYNSATLLFRFQFGAVSMIINLLNRNIDWIKMQTNMDAKAWVYPEYYFKRLSHHSGDTNTNGAP